MALLAPLPRHRRNTVASCRNRRSYGPNLARTRISRHDTEISGTIERNRTAAFPNFSSDLIINDFLGHAIGEKLHQSVAGRSMARVCRSDTASGLGRV